MAVVEVESIGIDPAALGVDHKVHWASVSRPKGRKENVRTNRVRGGIIDRALAG